MTSTNAGYLPPQVRLDGEPKATLWTPWSAATGCWGFEDAAGGDEVFRHLVLARMIEPASKLDSLRVVEEVGVAAAPYATVKRRLPEYPQEEWRQQLSAACPAHADLGRPAWSFTTCRRCTSRPARVTGSASRGSPWSGGWSRRSRSGCAMRRCVSGEVGDLPRPVCRRRWVEAEGSLVRAGVLRAGWQAALPKSERASTARWCGSGERVEKVYARNQCVIPR